MCPQLGLRASRFPLLILPDLFFPSTSGASLRRPPPMNPAPNVLLWFPSLLTLLTPPLEVGSVSPPPVTPLAPLASTASRPPTSAQWLLVHPWPLSYSESQVIFPKTQARSYHSSASRYGCLGRGLCSVSPTPRKVTLSKRSSGSSGSVDPDARCGRALRGAALGRTWGRCTGFLVPATPPP